MTIKEFAEQRGVSVQAVYQRLKVHGVKVESLRSPDTKALTPDGMIVLDKLFINFKSTEDAGFKHGSTDLINELNELKRQLAETTAKNEALQARVHELETERDWLRGQHSELLSRIPAALPAPGQTAQTEKRGLLARIFGR